MTHYKSTLNPFLSGFILEDGRETPLVDNTLYKQLVGSLLYLKHSRPNLSYAVGKAPRFIQELHELHWKDANHIIHYIHGTITFGIHYEIDSTLDLIGFIDSDWAGDSTDRKSTFGYSLSLGSSPISWSSKKQFVISLSSSKAEYRGVVNITI
jgi:hypothetical protein